MNNSVDALDYIEQALELLPSDPAEATVEDLARLAAIQAGSSRIVEQLRGAAQALARRLLTSDADAPNELDQLVDEALALQILHRRCERADRRLNAYTAAAVEACGINLADLLAGDKPGGST